MCFEILRKDIFEGIQIHKKGCEAVGKGFKLNSEAKKKSFLGSRRAFEKGISGFGFPEVLSTSLPLESLEKRI